MIMKRVIEICMESPLYFTMPLRIRLELIRKLAGSNHESNFREELLHWVKTGNLTVSARTKKRHRNASL